MNTTPAVITSAILRFCRGVSPTYQPTFHEVEVHPDSAPLEYLDNCVKEIERNGGEIVYGWTVWSLPKNLITLVHHAVVCRDGRVIDTTPTRTRETRVLFLQDDKARPTGDVIPSHFFQIGDDPETLHLVEDMREIYDLHEDADAEREVRVLALV
ncbi:hypothetical protein [Zavarzinella formosa]|uniref:hypothetical protein n=1 Tax=Zavarzinella formosa TaxID=360055 RepID=UPI0012FB1C6D|nr:hypothetical protein [Zavarzinella formosa]